jgi:acyl dehydratase
MIHFSRLADLQSLVGQELGTSDWVTVTQAQIDQFAQATGDHQWIHVDPVRAAAGPFGTTIAHGFLTLALVPMLSEASFTIDDVTMGVNYGLNRVRFTAPVPSGSRVRGRFRLIEYKALEGGAQLCVEATLEREGSDKPVCVAESLSRRYTTPPGG